MTVYTEVWHKMRYDMEDKEKSLNNSNVKTILNVAQINYHFRDVKTGQLHDRSVFIIGNSENDCLGCISSSLPAKTKWGVDSFQTIFCSINAVTPTIKHLLFKELKGQFETETKKGLFTKKK